MFKNLIIYRIGQPASLSAAATAEALAAMPFEPCGSTQQFSAGWVPPRGIANGALLEVVGHHWIATAKVETKAVPSQVLNRRVDERAKALEDQTGRKPGKKQRRELKEEVLLELLPAAFPRQVTTSVWFDTAAGLLAIDCASATRAEGIATMLVKCLDGLSLRLLTTNTSPASAMALWLQSGEAPADFSVDRKLELKAIDETKATVRYNKHALDIGEVRAHIEQGKVPTSLAVTFRGRCSFILTDGMALRGITFDDGLFNVQGAEREDSFDANAVIGAGEMAMAIPALVQALGGELEQEAQTAAPPHGTGDDGPDPLLEQARSIVVSNNRASISLVQRHLQIGYNRAARLLESLEFAGVVSAMNTSGNRDVLA